MVCFALSAVALAAVLTTMHPAFADSVGATAPETAQASAPAPKQAAAQDPAARPSSSEAPAQINAGHGGDVITVGFGWG